MSNGLLIACDTGRDPQLSPALVAMDITETVHLIAARDSFQIGKTIDATELGSLASDIRRVRAPDTPVTTPCGGYAAFIPGLPAIALLRGVVMIARREFEREGAPMGIAAPAPAPALAPAGGDDLKPLPAKDIDSLWKAGSLATGGYSDSLPQYRLSDSVMSRMSRANANGEFYIPPIDQNLSYRDSSITKAKITTLLKVSGQAAATSDLQLQLVQGGQQVERQPDVGTGTDYDGVCKHRSAAIIACYCTPEASRAYMASVRFGELQKHTLVQGMTAKPLVLPTMVSMLESRLLEVAQRHSEGSLSIGDLLTIDQQVCRKIMERGGRVPVDGNSCIEYVCDSCPREWEVPHRPARSVACTVGLDQLSGDGGSSTYGQSLGPGSSVSGYSGLSRSVSQVDDYNSIKRERGRMQQERDEARRELKLATRGAGYDGDGKGKGGGYSGGGGKGGGGSKSYGGATRVIGGGNPNGGQICGKFNTFGGCSLLNCNFKHECNKSVTGGCACGDRRHSAGDHR